MIFFSKKNGFGVAPIVDHFWASMRLPIRFLAGLWLIHAVQHLFDLNWAIFGIYPRTEIGLRGIFFAPLLHGDWTHLVSNTLPFWVLATMLFYFFPRVANYVFLWLYLATGALVWAFARSETYHIGLSYIIYGLVSFVFWTGVFRRSIQSIALAVVVMFFYSGMFVGIVPSAENLARNISWESHLLGGMVGIYAAYRYRHEYEDDEFSDTPPSVKEEDKETFFEQNTFEATKWEREEAERRRHIAENQSPENPFKDWFSNHT